MLPSETITELLSIIKTQQPEIWNKFVDTPKPPDPPKPPTVPTKPILPLPSEDAGGQLVISNPGTYKLNKDIVSKNQGIIITCGDVTIDGNGHIIEFNTLSKNDVWGIHVCTADWAAEDQILPIEIRKLIKSPVQNVVIKNCCIRGWAAQRSHGIGGRQANKVSIENNIIEANGTDSQTIFFKWGTPNIDNNLLIIEMQGTNDRHLGPCNVGAQSMIAKNNIVFGGNSGFKCDNGSDFKIENNLISNSSYATNGYGVWLYNCQRGNVSYNRIYPFSGGRGVLINDGMDIKIENNVILAYESPNDEFGDDLNACGVRVRYNTKNVQIAGNHICAVGGDKYCSSSALYLTLHKDNNNLIISGNNLYAALLNNTNIKRTAKTVTFEGSQDGKIQLFDNFLNTSQYIFGLSGYDGPGKINKISIIEHNSLGVLDSSDQIVFDKEDYEVVKYDDNDIWSKIKEQYVDFITFNTLGMIFKQLTHNLALINSYMFFSGYTSGDEYLSVGENEDSTALIRPDAWPDIYIQNDSLPGNRYIDYNGYVWSRPNINGPYNQTKI